MHMVCADLEGVFVPEIWINVAEQTGIEALRLTTRDIADYDELMEKRLAILKAHGLKINDITRVIGSMKPLRGARGFLDWLRARTQVIILSDTFSQFAGPLMKKLGYPTLLCHTLSIDAGGNITGYRLRLPESKKKAVTCFKGLNFHIVAVGDSYNDIGMLTAADAGILFKPPASVSAEYPDFRVSRNYGELKRHIRELLKFTD